MYLWFAVLLALSIFIWLDRTVKINIQYLWCDTYFNFTITFNWCCLFDIIQVSQSKDLVFLDSSSNMEEYNLRVFVVVTHSVCGALLLGIFITSNEKEQTLKAALLKTTAMNCELRWKKCSQHLLQFFASSMFSNRFGVGYMRRRMASTWKIGLPCY